MNTNQVGNCEALATRIRNFRYRMDSEGQKEVVRICNDAMRGSISSVIRCLILMNDPLGENYIRALEDRRRAFECLKEAIREGIESTLLAAEALVRQEKECDRQCNFLLAVLRDTWAAYE